MKKGWKVTRLGDVAAVFDGPHATPKTVDKGPVFLGIGALQDGMINLGETRHVTARDFQQWTRRVKPQTDDIVFSYETRLGEAAIIPEGLECCLGRRMGLVRFDRERVIPRFFLYQYISPPFRKFLSSKTIRGATVDRISVREFPSFPISVPPLPEQQRIVGILDEAFEGIATAKANAEKNLQNARALFDSNLQSVFTHWDDSPMVPIGDVAEVFDGPHATPKTVDAGPVFLGISALQDGKINLGETRHVTPEDFRRWTRRVKPQTDDVVFSYETRLGQAAIIPEGLECCLGRRMGLVRVNRQRVDPRFFVYQYISPPFRKFLDSKTVRGATVDRIALKEFPSFSIRLPPLAEQKRMTNRLDMLKEKTQRLESLYQQKLVALEALKKSLLHQAFTGAL